MNKAIPAALALVAVVTTAAGTAEAQQKREKRSAAEVVAYEPGDASTQRRFEKADRVVLYKQQRKLLLMAGERVLEDFTVALGRYPVGHKVSEGDGRTPEGAYTLDSKLTDSLFYRAIHISYPNYDDVERARFLGVRPGGAIMIHGLPKGRSARSVGHPTLDWTSGCIAVTNREMDRIWARIDAGTPIEIHP
jgi:murein L,D-transpeptidase YafK